MKKHRTAPPFGSFLTLAVITSTLPTTPRLRAQATAPAPGGAAPANPAAAPAGEVVRLSPFEVATSSNDIATANRVRGLDAADTAQNNDPTISRIPFDAYNTNTVEINRGPNSLLSTFAF